jgi:signal transduction histidine kinase
MKIGIRAKLVELLTVIALAPMLVAIGIMAYAWAQIRVETAGRQMQAIAQGEALARQVTLAKDIEIFLVFAQGKTVFDYLDAGTVKLPESELNRLDSEWATLTPDQKPLDNILHNPVSEILKVIQREDPQMREIMVTDRFGQLVAATGHTTDFYQADENWWQQTYAQGQGRIYIAPVGYDESSAVWSIDLCLPIRSNGQIVGIVKCVIDVAQWTRLIGLPAMGMPAGLMLVGKEGLISYREGVTPLTAQVSNWSGSLASGEVGWRVENNEIQGFVPVRMPDKIGSYDVHVPPWRVVIYVSYSTVMTPIYKLTAIAVATGIVIVAGLFLLGVLLVDRTVVRRILQVEQATAKVAQGDLSQRVQQRPIKGAGDEIDQLTKVFNQMIERVQKSTQSLQSANELKTNFIRVAGHELRTPISYILGMARLLKDSTDAARLQFAVQSMGAKAKRINEIIQAMFKLMPDQLHRDDMFYTHVDINELLEEIYIDIFPFIEKRNQRLVIEAAEKPPTLKADREKLRDAIENLLMNAVKFTPDGGIVKLRTSMLLGDRLMVSVQDQGPGIPESEYPRLFQPFYSGSDVMTHSTGESGYQKRGIGLGLAIVRHFVEMHHGTVQVSSSPMGSTFGFIIPIEPPPESPPPSNEPPRDAAEGKS